MGPRKPVEWVSWTDAGSFFRKLNEAQRAAGWLPDGFEFRLPTEAEWEYACRAGTTTDFAGNPDEMAWYDANSGKQTHEVGQKKPNAWGLYDMHGNLFEWCMDWHDNAYYSRSPATDPVCLGPDTGNMSCRGGDWKVGPSCCSSRHRGGGRYGVGTGQIAAADVLGFRVALAPPLSTAAQ